MSKNVKIILIGILAFIILLIANYIYNSNNYTQKWLICEFITDYSNYKEELKFNYVQDIMYEYEREEYMGATKDDSLEDIFDFFLNQKSELKEYIGDEFKYNIELIDEQVHVHTYIKTLTQKDFFNSYLKSKKITTDLTSKEIEELLIDDYKCHIVKV